MTEIAPQPRIKLSKLRDIGWSLWDPIGLLDPESRAGRWDDEANLSFADEYDSYLIAAASQLRRGAPRDEVVAFLVEIETQHMGMGDNPSARPRAEAVVEAILADETIWTWPDAQGRFGQGMMHRRNPGDRMTRHRIFTTSFASVYPHYVAKAEKKGRTRADVDEIICWLTGYSPEQLAARLEDRTDFESFFAGAPRMNPARSLIKGVVCGVRMEEVEDPLMREIRYLDKLIDELAKGKPMEKILRKG